MTVGWEHFDAFVGVLVQLMVLGAVIGVAGLLARLVFVVLRWLRVL